MIENSTGSPIFADRYRFQPVTSDWDVGRSGFTHLVFDMKKERLGVIKRADLKSQHAVEGLKNEVAALLDLKDSKDPQKPNVPEVYDTGEAEYGSKNYFYVVIEYIEGIRIEKNLDTLDATERAEILTQFFDLLSKAHNQGIINGDIDLKHLFWRRDKKKLIVIDWGNATHNTNLKKKTEFAYDLARSAEIIYTLVTRKGRPASTGPVTLPKDSALFPGLSHLPPEFRSLCKWAPRNPTIGAQQPQQAPCTAKDLFGAARTWRKGVPYKTTRGSKFSWIILIFMAIIAGMGILIYKNPGWLSPLLPKIATPTVSTTSTLPATKAIIPAEVGSPTITPTEITFPTNIPTSTPSLRSSPTFTPLSAITPTPRSYNDATPVITLDKNYSSSECWDTTTNSPLGLQRNDGFTKRGDGNWRFGTFKDHPANTFVQVDFQKCNPDRKINALALNLWVEQLEIENQPSSQLETFIPEKEIGVFTEDSKGQRRVYTLWMDNTGSLHFRVRENDTIVHDEIKAVVNNLDITRSFPHSYAKFSIRIFFEINNNNLDIVYLEGGSLTQTPGSRSDILPSESTRVDSATLSSMSEIQKIGLIGYGGATQTIVWPLILYGK